MLNLQDKPVPVKWEYLQHMLLSMGEFYYWPNDGNLGDYLIAEATRQLFRQFGLKWKEYNPEIPPIDASYNIVYGGGGRFVPHWGGMDIFQKHLTAPQVSKCIILPHSINGVDDFISSLDERHVVFCREYKTLDYCCAVNTTAQFVLAHDMGLYIQMEKLPSLHRVVSLPAGAENESKAQAQLLTCRQLSRIYEKIRWSAVRINSRSIAFLLRTDREKQTSHSSLLSFDLSLVYSASCRESPYSSQLVRMMAEALRIPDVIVTDRLHVAIMAMHVGKEVYMLDNDYGKLSGVYEVSLKDKPNVHLIPPGTAWPEEIDAAWQRLNAPWRRFAYGTRFIFPAKIWNISRKILKRILMR